MLKPLLFTALFAALEVLAPTPPRPVGGGKCLRPRPQAPRRRGYCPRSSTSGLGLRTPLPPAPGVTVVVRPSSAPPRTVR